MSDRTAAVVRELVRYLEGDEPALALLHRVLCDLDSTLCPLIPPPPALPRPSLAGGGGEAPPAGRWDG
jgi:hypothetical protein